MAKRMKIDELNILRSDESAEAFDRQNYIEHYFDVMQITERQKRERIEAAEELFDAILLFLMWCEENPENVQAADTQRDMQNLYKEVVFQHVEPSDFIDIYVPLFISNLIDITVNHPDDTYYTSVERATNVACNEANSITNYSEVQTAKNLGYTHKQWIAELDNRTRDDHISMDGTVIPIDDYFVFSDCMMFMPHDEVNGTAMQCANCRCSLKYLNMVSTGSRNLAEEAFAEEEKAKMLYNEIINRKKEFEIKAVASHSNYSYDEIEKIYEHVFIREHLFEDGSVHKFIPDIEMANSWLRIRNGHPLEHDFILLNHEFEEEKIMGNRLDIPYEIAHYNVISMGEEYDYDSSLSKYLESRNKNANV